jgi:hypothetical protein
MAHVAHGFRARSGWATAVAVAAPRQSPVVVLRRRVELADPDIPGSRQPYHAGEDLALEAAERIVALCGERTAELAYQAVHSLADELRTNGHHLDGCGILTGSDRPTGTVRDILASHPWMHAAEGQFFRNALMEAAHQCGLLLMTLPERGAYAIGAAHFIRTEEQLEQDLKEMGQRLGPPWRQDEKLAALVAWLTLSQAEPAVSPG